MKRTPKKGGEKRDAVFRFRVTPAEKELIQQNANNAGLSISDYIRKKADEYQSGFDRNTLIRLLAETGKQGSNLNQYTKAMNVWMKTGNDLKIEPETIRHCIEEITRLTKEILQIIKNVRRRKNQG